MSEPVAASAAAPESAAEELPTDVGGMLSLLYEDTDEPAPAAEPADEPAAAAGDQTTEPPSPVESESEEDEDFEVSDKKPWTAERAAKAHKATLQLRTKMQRWNMKLDKKTAKIQKAAGNLEAREERLQLVERQLSKDVAALQHASGREVLDVLARLTGQDADRLYEDMSLGVLGRRNTDPNAKKVAALESELEKLKADREVERRRAEMQESHARIYRDAQAIVTDADAFPALTERCAPDPQAGAQEFVDIYVEESKRAGYWLDIESVAAKIELHYQRQKRTSPPATQNPVAGRAPITPDTTVHKSLSPSLSQQDGGSVRELSERERIAELARDPEFLRALGL